VQFHETLRITVVTEMSCLFCSLPSLQFGR